MRDGWLDAATRAAVARLFDTPGVTGPVWVQGRGCSCSPGAVDRARRRVLVDARARGAGGLAAALERRRLAGPAAWPGASRVTEWAREPPCRNTGRHVHRSLRPAIAPFRRLRARPAGRVRRRPQALGDGHRRARRRGQRRSPRTVRRAQLSASREEERDRSRPRARVDDRPASPPDDSHRGRRQQDRS